MRFVSALTLFLQTVLSGAASIKPVSNVIAFEPNIGQVSQSVHWVVRHGSSTPMFLRATGAAITTYDHGRAHFIQLRFDGARSDAPSSGESPLASYSNYYLTGDERSWFTGVPQFARVRFHDVYPGIDVVYHSNGSEIEYDFDIHPGADPSQIHISFRNIDSLRIDHGNIILTSGGRELRQRRPRVFQNGCEIEASYRIAGDDSHVEIALSVYDVSISLLIDPSIQFASYLGGAGNEKVEAIKVDSQGYIYIAGASESIVSPGLNPFTQSGVVVDSPVIFKFTPDGKSLVYFLTMVVDDKTFVEGLAIDSAGNLMIAGETAALQLPLKNPIDSRFKAQVATAFAAKWTADGRSLVYSTYFGGSGNEHARAGAAVDSGGNLYFAGITSSQDLPVVNAMQPAHGGGGQGLFPIGLIWNSGTGTPLDCYVTKLSPQGQIVFSTYLGGSDDDYCLAMSLAPDGGIVVGGESGLNFPLVNALLKPYGIVPFLGSPMVAKIRADGQAMEFSTFICESASPSLIGNTVGGNIRALAVDPAGNIYTSGTCDSGLATSPNAFRQAIPSTQSGVFVAALNTTGQKLLYRTYLDNNSPPAFVSTPTGLVVDAQGSLYVTGGTADSNFPTINSLQPFEGTSDFFITRLAPSGSSSTFSTFLGSSESNAVLALAADGSLYFAGTTQSTNLPVKNAFQSTLGGGLDMFFMKLTDAAVEAGPPAAISAASGTPQITATNSAFPLQLRARVTDASGNPVSGVTVNFSVPVTGPSVTLSSASAQTDSTGAAGVTATANGITGNYTVTATTPSVSGIASFALTNAAPNVTVQSSPPGIPFSVNGVTYSAAQSFYFPPGSKQTLSVNPSTNVTGIQATFLNWSDGQPFTHFITATDTLTTYTATFSAKYQLTTAVSPTGGGTVTPVSGNYYDAGSIVQVTAAPLGSFGFISWVGAVTPTGPLTGTVVMTGPLSITANFAVAGPLPSTITALLNSASYASGAIAPNEFLAAFGAFPGCTTSNTQVTIDTTPAPVLYASSTQVNFLVPSVTTASAVRIACPGSTPVPFSVTLAASAPGLFTASQDGKGQVAVVNQDYSVNTPSPAGSYISVYGTGFGAYNPPSSDGLTHLTLPVTGILNPVVGLGPSYPVTVVFAGQAPGYSPGLQQINLQIPPNVPAGAFQLVLTTGSGSTTQSTATIQITHPTPSEAQ